MKMTSLFRSKKARKTHKTTRKKTRLFDTNRPTEVVRSIHFDKVVRVYLTYDWPKRFCRQERVRIQDCEFTQSIKPNSICWCTHVENLKFWSSHKGYLCWLAATKAK